MARIWDLFQFTHFPQASLCAPAHTASLSFLWVSDVPEQPASLILVCTLTIHVQQSVGE